MNTTTDERGLYQLGFVAAVFALSALLVGGVIMTVTSSAQTAGGGGTLTAIGPNQGLMTIGLVAITLVSLFDLFTVPGLFAALWRRSFVAATVAALAALIGDMLGVLAGLIQIATGILKVETGSNVYAAEALSALERVIGSAGFVLVGVSFLSFGVAILRGASGRWLGWVALVAGGLTILGQVPSLAVLFMVANIAFILWYIGIAGRFSRLAPRRQAISQPEQAPQSSVG